MKALHTTGMLIALYRWESTGASTRQTLMTFSTMLPKAGTILLSGAAQSEKAAENNGMPNNPSPAPKSCSIAAYVILGAALYAFIQTFTLLAPILLSLLLILLITLAVNPTISRIRHWVGGRRRATALVLVAMIAMIALTSWAAFGPMKASVVNMGQQLPAYWERFQKPLIKMEQKAVISEERLQAEVTMEIADAETAQDKVRPAPSAPKASLSIPATESGSIRSSLTDMFQGVFGRFTSVVFNATQILVVLVTVFFGVIFTLMDPRPIFGAIFAMVPERHHAQALTIMQRIGKFVPGWAGAVLFGMLTIGVLVFILMWPIFGFKDALVLALIAGMMEAIPFIGPIISAVPALLLAFGEGGMTPLWVFLAYIAIQSVENNLILPFVMARGMKLHPIAVIFSMLLCVAAFGVLGVLVAAPLVAIVNILHDELYRKRFLPTLTDADLDDLARCALHEELSNSTHHGGKKEEAGIYRH